MENSQSLNINVKCIGRNGKVRVFNYTINGLKENSNPMENCFGYLEVIENYLKIE